jgi:uncharacterized protein
MQLLEGALVLSPSDLHSFLECQHLTALQILVSRGSLERQRVADEAIELLRRKGFDHEQAWLARLRSEGRRIVEIQRAESCSRSWEDAAAATEAAMRDGADVIYQGVLAHSAWRGVADFLIRVHGRTALGGWGYEAWDTKLARLSKPYFMLQLAFYSEAIARVQGSVPARMHVVLGTSETDTFSTGDFDAYFRYLKHRLSAFVTAPSETRPYPVAHCAFCDFSERCEEYWEREDHLSRVSHIRREQVARLEEMGVRTVAALGATVGPLDVRIGASTLTSLIAQARLQSQARLSGAHAYELLPA